eukprot:symbB.v1.2.028632.t1/scaffold3052.1/size64688/2
MLPPAAFSTTCCPFFQKHVFFAKKVAKAEGHQKDEEISLAMLGVARGMLNFDEHCAELVRHAAEAALDVEEVRAG